MDPPKFEQVSEMGEGWMNRWYLSWDQGIGNSLLLQRKGTKLMRGLEDHRRRRLIGEFKRIGASSGKGEIFVGREFCQIPWIPLVVVIRHIIVNDRLHFIKSGIACQIKSFIWPKKLSCSALSQQFPLRDIERRRSVRSTSSMNLQLV